MPFTPVGRILSNLRSTLLSHNILFFVRFCVNTNTHSIVITVYEYDVLNKNGMISMLCAKQLKSAVKHGDEIELVITLSDLTDLIGHVAAEANHARSKRKSEDLNAICDYLENAEQSIKRQL